MTSLKDRRETKDTNAAMTKHWIRRMMLGAIALMAVSTTGCYGVHNGFNLGWVGYPLPVSPYYQHKQEEKFWKKERYDRVPILGPTTSGGPIVALDPPTDDEIMHALEKARPVQGGIPLLFGPAQLHHAHYKCTVYFDEKVIVGYPVPHTMDDREAVETIYIDHNHFHMVGDVEPYDVPNL
jgi:hypothetical protein